MTLREIINPNNFVGPVFRFAVKCAPWLAVVPVFRNYAAIEEVEKGGDASDRKDIQNN